MRIVRSDSPLNLFVHGAGVVLADVVCHLDHLHRQGAGAQIDFNPVSGLDFVAGLHLIDACLQDPRYAAGRQQVKAETWAEPGQGARLAADYLEAKLRELNAKEEG